MPTQLPSDRARLALVLVGLGPRGAGLLERVVANAATGLGGSAESPVRVHLVDPFPAGGGRVWRDEQSRLLRLNTTTEDLTAFVDASVDMAGPITPGPTLFEWCRTHGVDLDDPELAAEAAALGPLDFPTRRLASAYFGFALDRARRRAPHWLEIVTHATRAVDLAPAGDDTRQVVVLENGDRLVADAVVITTSHVDLAPAPRYAALAAFAADHDLTYVPPGYGGDLDLSAVPAGQDTIVRGLGLGFVDLMILLTEGRGGRFVDAAEDGLRYLPSGREPHLLVGSRRGVPYHAKPMYRLQSAKLAATTFCTSDAVTALLDRGTSIDFWVDLWPLIGREVAWAYYAELGRGHPGRIAVQWSEFAAAYADVRWGSAAYERWICSVVPDVADRLDLLAIDRPLGDVIGVSAATVAAHVRADLQRRRDVSYSADLAAFHALLAVLPVVGPALASPLMDARSLLDEANGWFLGFFSFFASGPPPDRLDQLLALERAGVLSFLGGDLEVDVDAEQAAFVARSMIFPDGITAPGLIDATLPTFELVRTTDPLLSSLARRGDVSSRVLVAADGRLIDTGQIRVDARQRLVRADGRSAPRTFALGMHTMIKAAAFARPGSNAPVHRLNDQVARTLLDLPRPIEPIAALSGSGGYDHAH